MRLNGLIRAGPLIALERERRWGRIVDRVAVELELRCGGVAMTREKEGVERSRRSVCSSQCNGVKMVQSRRLGANDEAC